MSKKTKTPAKRHCHCYRRYGSAFTLGPAKWEQCKNESSVMLTFEDEGKIKILPACSECWKECIQNKVKILEVEPL